MPQTSRHSLPWLLALCTLLIAGGSPAIAHAADATRTFVDSAGRSLTLPREVKKVFSVGHPGTQLLYTLCRDKIVAWNAVPTESQRRFIPQKYADLPAIGGWGGSNTQINLEQLVTLHPDVIVSIGEMSSYWRSNADRVQDQTGIPVALIAGELPSLDETYRKVGELVDARERAEKLAAYCREALDAVQRGVGTIPEGKRARVYYAEGPRGLQTDPPGSFHTQVLEFAHGINVATSVTKGGAGRSDVSMESIAAWAPRCILVEADTPQAAADPIHTIFGDPAWQIVPAIRAGAVHVIPQQPYNWFGRPPSVNRILGIQWVAHILYPEAYPVDILAIVKRYYALFYEVSLTDEEAKRLERGETLK